MLRKLALACGCVPTLRQKQKTKTKTAITLFLLYFTPEGFSVLPRHTQWQGRGEANGMHANNRKLTSASTGGGFLGVVHASSGVGMCPNFADGLQTTTSGRDHETQVERWPHFQPPASASASSSSSSVGSNPNNSTTSSASNTGWSGNISERAFQGLPSEPKPAPLCPFVPIRGRDTTLPLPIRRLHTALVRPGVVPVPGGITHLHLHQHLRLRGWCATRAREGGRRLAKEGTARGCVVDRRHHLRRRHRRRRRVVCGRTTVQGVRGGTLRKAAHCQLVQLEPRIGRQHAQVTPREGRGEAWLAHTHAPRERPHILGGDSDAARLFRGERRRRLRGCVPPQDAVALHCSHTGRDR